MRVRILFDDNDMTPFGRMVEGWVTNLDFTLEPPETYMADSGFHEMVGHPERRMNLSIAIVDSFRTAPEFNNLERVDVKDLVMDFPKTLNGLFMEAVENYEIAKKAGDTKRLTQFRNDAFQCIAINNDMIRCKVQYDKNWGRWKMTRFGLETTTDDVEKKIKKILNKKNLPKEKMLDTEQPYKLTDYPNDIPGNVYNKIKKAQDTFKGKELSFFCVDLDKDPILFVQVEGKKEYTFMLGFWE